MTYEQVRDILERIRSFHRRLRDALEEVRSTSKDERTQFLLEEIRRDEWKTPWRSTRRTD